LPSRHEKIARNHIEDSALLTYLMQFAFFSAGTACFRPVPARIWFHFVERLARNHIDEWLLTREHHQEGIR
jgi:hypothetical protein